jgi:hypothetical protein
MMRVLAVAFTLTMLTTGAFADPIGGSYSIFGNFLPVDGSTGASATIGSATGIDFLNLFSSTPTPGTAGQFLIGSATGNFSPFLGSVGSIKDLSFAGPGSANFPLAPITTFENVIGASTLTFDLQSLTVTCQNAAACPNSLVLSGNGLIHLTGFDDTPGTFLFTGQGTGEGALTFSAFDSTGGGTAPVPEPASIVLLGSGVAGAILKRRKRQ